jgi:hypothetical protein
MWPFRKKEKELCPVRKNEHDYAYIGVWSVVLEETPIATLKIDHDTWKCAYCGKVRSEVARSYSHYGDYVAKPEWTFKKKGD